MLTFLVRTLTVFLAASNAFTDEPLQTQDGPLAIVTVESLTLEDSVRKKDLMCKAHVPTTGGPYPLILFSHGFGGNQDAFGPVGRYWASHGYVVVHPSHADGGRQTMQHPILGCVP